MTITEIASIVTATAAFGAFVTSLINTGKINTVHVAINSRMDELLKQSGISSRAEGREEGRREARQHKEKD